MDCRYAVKPRLAVGYGMNTSRFFSKVVKKKQKHIYDMHIIYNSYIYTYTIMCDTQKYLQVRN